MNSNTFPKVDFPASKFDHFFPVISSQMNAWIPYLYVWETLSEGVEDHKPGDLKIFMKMYLLFLISSIFSMYLVTLAPVKYISNHF